MPLLLKQDGSFDDIHSDVRIGVMGDLNNEGSLFDPAIR